MLDKKSQAMLAVASELTAEDLVAVRNTAPPLESEAGHAENIVSTRDESPVDDGPSESPNAHDGSGLSMGQRERLRSRESKVSTAAMGATRTKHEWWSVGTELVGRMGSEVFTAVVVENDRLKSGKSLRITSGAASGRICNTPTRAAIEATEAYRQANNLGRGGGITNGWTFWQQKA